MCWRCKQLVNILQVSTSEQNRQQKFPLDKRLQIRSGWFPDNTTSLNWSNPPAGWEGGMMGGLRGLQGLSPQTRSCFAWKRPAWLLSSHSGEVGSDMKEDILCSMDPAHEAGWLLLAGASEWNLEGRMKSYCCFQRKRGACKRAGGGVLYGQMLFHCFSEI